MPKPPKSPLEKPSSGHTRRPSGGSRRTSSSEKISSHPSSSKHGIKVTSGHASTGKSPATMSVYSTAAEAPDISRGKPDVEGRFGPNETKSESTITREATPTQHSYQNLDKSEVENGLEDNDRVSTTGRYDDELERISEETVTSKSTTEEVDRLRAAMHAKISLSQQRERLAKHLTEREKQGSIASPGAASSKSRVSPINEEEAPLSPSLEAAFASPVVSAMDTNSTESAKTLRGEFTPSAFAARTPSYPFPPMKTPRNLSFTGHRPFTALSPTVAPEYFSADGPDTPRDRWNSGSVTPASAMTFQPGETSQTREDPNYSSPNLYELSLMLASEPGLDAWWTTVVQIMRDIYKADRVTLAVPADATDIENVPWGQKATFNAVEEDQLSMEYLPRGSSLVPSSGGETNSTSVSGSINTNPYNELQPGLAPHQDGRPGLQSRHSFTAYEDTRRAPVAQQETTRTTAVRPPVLPRSISYFPPGSEPTPRSTLLQNTAMSLRSLDDRIAFEEDKVSSWGTVDVPSLDVSGRVFPVLQALDYEADPLIDSTGVIRVLERGRLIALTRDYPYLQDPEPTSAGEGKPSTGSKRFKESFVAKGKKPRTPEVISRMSSIFGGTSTSSHRPGRSSSGQTNDKGKATVSASHPLDEVPSLPSPRYEEYEQVPPSPWSQSPAPSPAIRADPSENPFFAAAEVDEESFNPTPVLQDYSSSQQVEAIGIDRSYTVLHIPLNHPLLSKPVQSFRLDTAAIESKTAARSQDKSQQFIDTPRSQGKAPALERRTPVAILSIISPVIPYPSNLRHSLENLSPHLATSFSLCQHYSNLETEIAGLQRKRPHVSGFGAVARPLETQTNMINPLYSPSEDEPRQHSAGSITSPSDYSGVSRSNAGSPSGTPAWDPNITGFSMERRSTGVSPGYVAGSGEGYFGSRTRTNPAKVDTGLSSSTVGGKRSSKETSPTDPRQSRNQEQNMPTGERGEIVERIKPKVDQDRLKGDQNATSLQTKQVRIDRLPGDIILEHPEIRDLSPSRVATDATHPPRRQAMRAASIQSVRSEHIHTKLHTGGVDLGTTFPSLPTRAGVASGPAEMLPPSDRLKTLMLDTLPCHVFVALPVTGEIVWVNNRYLSYRGQTIPHLREDPWGSIHPDEREDYLKAWGDSIRTGQPFSKQVRIRRFDGSYRWFFTRAVAGKDTRNVIVQWYGSHMDIHDQHVAEVKAARQEESEASEANYRLLANLIPQIIFAASEEKGVIFANEQWLSYTGQEYEEALELGFMDFVHPEDLAKCRIPFGLPNSAEEDMKSRKAKGPGSQSSSGGKSSSTDTKSSRNPSEAPTEATVRNNDSTLSRTNSSSSGSRYDTSDFAALAKSGLVQMAIDGDGRQSYTTEVRLRSKSGEYRWHLVRCVEVDNFKFGGNGHGSWFGACTDINDHKLLETKLKEAMDSKTRFLSNMSHEIRTPLIGISGMISFLQDTILNEEQLDYTNTIQTSANSLLSIINDILDLSKVDAGMMKLSFEWFHARSVIEEVNELVSTMAISKRLELNYVVDEDVPAMVKGDKVRIRQVLLNVIGNAIKFTSEGEVFSTCRVYRDETAEVGENEIMLEFSVVDTGRGFTKEEKELIFKPFSQIDGSSTRQHGGSGLGLVISRQLVELHGGKMEGSAVPGQGSTFTFTAKFELPTETDHPEEPLPTPLLSKTPSFRSTASAEGSTRAMRSVTGDPIVSHRFLTSPTPISPRTDPGLDSPAVASSASSDPSVRSVRTYMTTKSSSSSINQGLTHFSEAARASGQDLLNMKLAIPPKVSSDTTPTQESNSPVRTESGSSVSDIKHFRPPMYSILVICPQNHSREATTKHIEQTLPKEVPYQITTSASVIESQKMIGGDDPVIFTHIVLNLGSPEEIIALMDQIFNSVSHPQTSVVILSDPVQRQAIIKMAAHYDYDQLAKENRVTFIYKPVKPSRFAVIFDPDKERDLSTDRNRSSAQQQVANQKQNYLDVEARLGNKGHKILLVEDNLVNQKVLLKYLTKVGINVEIAYDGVECTEKLFAKPHDHYSLILVSHISFYWDLI
jgi:nitrogen-specific signal transduction histidine kinase/PAS domain-containing protein